MNLSWSLLLTQFTLLIGVLLGVVLVVHILLQQRSTPQVTIAWLLAIILLPYLGVPLYLLFGGRKVRRATALKNRLDLSPLSLPLPDATGPVRRLLEAYGLPAPSADNRVELLQDGEATYHRLLQLIREANRSVHIAIYLFGPDEVGRVVRDHLTEKARAGVQVRVLLDGVGSLHTPRRFFRDLLEAGGEVVYFMPLLRRPFRGRTNLRNHRKIVVIDDVTVWTGGRNIGSDYMGREPHPRRWHDLSFLLRGPAVVHYRDVFRADWEFAYGDHRDTSWLPPQSVAETFPGRNIVQIVPSGPDLPHDALYAAIVYMAYAAQERLWIVSPYFVPDRALTQALEIAARRGIDVRICVPARSNHTLADLVRGPYLRELQQAGARILLYERGMLHAKLLLKDRDTVMIGSANMDIRSLFLDYEIAAFFYDDQTIEAVEGWIVETRRGCREGVQEASVVRSLFEAVTHIVAPVV